MNKYRLEDAIEAALKEYQGLEPEAQTPINIMLLARKHSPATIRQCMDVVEQNQWFQVLDAKPGNLIMDVLIATATSYIASSLNYKIEKEHERMLMEEARRPRLLR